MSLFQKIIVKKYLNKLPSELIEEYYQKYSVHFLDPAMAERVKALKEEQYQEGFLRDLFVKCLGYTINPYKAFDLTTEYKNKTDAEKADGAILKDGKPIAVIELKSTKTKDLKTIEKQAFNYKAHQSNCKYVITSNFDKIRLYINDATEFEEFNVFELSQNEFKFLYLCLSKESIYEDIPAEMKEKSNQHEELISKKLYNDYSIFRNSIFQNLTKNNPQIDKLLLFKKAQKLLDRFLFIFFAEDKGLIPPNIISKIIDDYNKLKDLDVYTPLYAIFKKYFSYINKGYEKLSIDAYNGGLFQFDEILDNVEIDDEILITDSLKLSNYDFDSEIDVNILGHIFEHSLTDIEKLNAEISGENLDKKQTRRKKEGVFYTPNYITKYIVENTIGTLCSEKRNELQLNNLEVDETYFKKGRKAIPSQKGERLFDKLEEYKKWLLSLKILDPACGSGAFLNQALNFLIDEHNFIIDLETDLRKGQYFAFDIDTAVLENNLYGVDINEESVEIAKLSLWLKTAQKGRRLTDLSKHIKCGNSLIDDPEIAGDKAFGWDKEFPDIMKHGGFDVVIGNPPYVQVTEFQEYYNKNYNTSDCGDLYVLFIEKSLKLLKENGMFSFITPSLYIKGVRYETLRQYLLTNFDIIEILDKGDGVFRDVQMPTAILNIRNRKITKQKWNDFIDCFNIISQFEINSVYLGTISKIRRGLEIGKDKIIDDKSGIKIITGEDISKYAINHISYINSEIYENFKKDNSFFSGCRILIRETGNRITSLIVNNNLQQNRSLYSIKISNTKFSPYYILAIINSSLIQYFYKMKFAANTNIFPKIRIAQVKEIPIKIDSLQSQQPFIEKADLMLFFNKQKQEKINRFLHRLETNFEIEKFSNKMKAFYDYDFKTLITEFKKKKIKLTLSQQDEWEEYFNSYKEEILKLQKQIDKTDKEIDQMVYELYGLTDEEIEIVENAVK